MIRRLAAYLVVGTVVVLLSQPAWADDGNLVSALERLILRPAASSAVVVRATPGMRSLGFVHEDGVLYYDFAVESATRPGADRYLRYRGSHKAPPPIPNARERFSYMSASEVAKLRAVLRRSGLSDEMTYQEGVNAAGYPVGWLALIRGPYGADPKGVAAFVRTIFVEVFAIPDGTYTLDIEEI